ncbi:MAG TPA: hypothetical protein VMW13_05790 [Dehalococcoidales bacterium]|nr:hypothetical protein [Dehalococcoidales bacterium]
MTAAEVCQYVNQALPDEHESCNNYKLRYEYRYTVQNAEYLGYQPTLVSDSAIKEIHEFPPKNRYIFLENLSEQYPDIDPNSMWGSEEGWWLVTVEVTKEKQLLREGQWVEFLSNPDTEIYGELYFFDENLAQLW